MIDKNNWKKEKKPNSEGINHWNEVKISKKVEISSLKLENMLLKEKLKKFRKLLQENHKWESMDNYYEGKKFEHLLNEFDNFFKQDYLK